MMDSVSWGETMQSSRDNDLEDFLFDFPGMGDEAAFGFPDFSNNQNGAHAMPQAPQQQSPDTPMTGTDINPSDVHSFHHQPQQQHHHHHHHSMTSPMAAGLPFHQPMPTPAMSTPGSSHTMLDQLKAQVQILELEHQKMQDQQRRQLEEQHSAFLAQQRNNMVPPTPQSLELQAGAGHGYPQHSQPDRASQQVADYQYQLQEQQSMSFTPLVSPAVTPLDQNFSIDTSQLTMPGTYFSPLTSPALHAQNDPIATFGGMHSQVNTTSQGDLDLGITSPTGISATGINTTSVGTGPVAPVVGTNLVENPTRRRKATTARGKTTTSVRQSPLVRPRRQRTTTTPVLNTNTQGMAGNAEQNNQVRSPQLPLPAVPTTSSSSGGRLSESENNSSVSPENLNDDSVEMPPPPKPKPKPKSTQRSPPVGPKQGAAPGSTNGGSGSAQLAGVPSPATPASLMKLSSPGSRSSAASRVSSQEPVAAEHIEDLELPESADFPKGPGMLASVEAATTPGLTPLEPGSSTPIAGSSSVPLPLPSPVFPRPAEAGTASASQSPQLTPGSASASAGASARRTPQLVPRGAAKKRTGSAHVSPALRPKISPSIKPLLPGGGGSGTQDATLELLASKSNYQRFLDGSNVPGIEYPKELSANLSSKRTSHKIAEQGRRDRINLALQQIASLLPPREGAEGEGGSGGDSNGNNNTKKDATATPNSKAATVEHAIEYIRRLEGEVAEARKRAEVAEKKLHDCIKEKESAASTTAGPSPEPLAAEPDTANMVSE